MTQSSPESVSGHTQSLAEVAPGNSVYKANEDTNQLTAAPILSRDNDEAPGSNQASLSINPSEKCACIVCLSVGIYDLIKCGPEHCHFVSCNWTLGDRIRQGLGSFRIRKYRAAHARSHYQRGEGPKESQPFHCSVENCHYSVKRWSDLQRHTTTTHCKNPAMFECSVIGCKYHGEGNGFTRKDKLTAHYRSMHNGQRVPGQVSRTLQPAPASSHAQASGSNSIAGQQQ